jgi:hypothetical protein
MKLSRIEGRLFDTLLTLSAEGSKVPPDIEKSRRIFEEVLDYSVLESRVFFRAALVALELASPLFGAWSKCWLPFSKRSLAEQKEAIERIQHSRIALRRFAFKALSAAVQLAHYSRPDVQLAVGYDAKKLNVHYQTLPRSEAK